MNGNNGASLNSIAGKAECTFRGEHTFEHSPPLNMPMFKAMIYNTFSWEKNMVVFEVQKSFRG